MAFLKSRLGIAPTVFEMRTDTSTGQRSLLPCLAHHTHACNTAQAPAPLGTGVTQGNFHVAAVLLQVLAGLVTEF